MKTTDLPVDRFAQWEGAVAFRLFADQSDPTLTVSEQIAARLGDRILSGAMPPGARIGEQELADEFAVSRGPIREALRILEREGLATLLPRRGAIVTDLTASELRELLEVRAGLFELVVRKIAARPSPEILTLMEAGVTRLEVLSTAEDGGDDYAETAYRLMILCARQCGNRRLQRMLTALSLQTLRYSKLGLASVERRQRSARLWREATTALARGDVERMVALTRQRIEESGEEAIRQLGLPAHPGDQP
ncbi:MAG: GntR family transcriptional regulator [Burkholderiaceae bacterium]|jgi:DNA-binding GntR family transcriptional regulator|nr:GntR family transcriptional regulator [Burkholderiaceae bacterium]